MDIDKHITLAWDPCNLRLIHSRDNMKKGCILNFKLYPEQKIVWKMLKLDKISHELKLPKDL